MSSALAPLKIEVDILVDTGQQRCAFPARLTPRNRPVPNRGTPTRGRSIQSRRPVCPVGDRADIGPIALWPRLPGFACRGYIIPEKGDVSAWCIPPITIPTLGVISPV